MGVYGTRDGKFHARKITVEDKMPVQFVIPYGVATSSTYFLDAQDFSGATTAVTNSGLLLQPPYPVELSVQAVSAGTTNGATGDGLVFKGIDAKGNAIREVIYVSSTGGSGAAAYTYSNNAFAKITSITPDDALHKSTDVNVGFRNVVGLPYEIASADDILSATIGLQYATTALTVDATYDSIDLTTALSAGSTANIMWKSKVQ